MLPAIAMAVAPTFEPELELAALEELDALELVTPTPVKAEPPTPKPPNPPRPELELELDDELELPVDASTTTLPPQAARRKVVLAMEAMRMRASLHALELQP